MSYFDMRGRRFPLWTSEPGVGRDKTTEITFKAAGATYTGRVEGTTMHGGIRDGEIEYQHMVMRKPE